jgi:fatty acid desaturase
MIWKSLEIIAMTILFGVIGAIFIATIAFVLGFPWIIPLIALVYGLLLGLYYMSPRLEKIWRGKNK